MKWNVNVCENILNSVKKHLIALTTNIHSYKNNNNWQQPTDNNQPQTTDSQQEQSSANNKHQ